VNSTHFESLDETVRAIRAECEMQLKAMADKLLAAEIESTLCRDLLKQSNDSRDAYMRVAERLVTQFATVEKVFADAKAYALALPEKEPPQADHPLLPKVELEGHGK
jgi:hypothetical protein